MTDESLAATTESQTSEADAEQIETPGAESAPAVTDADDTRKPKDGFSERIDELTRYRRDAERERDYWRDLALKSNQRDPEPSRERPPPEESDDQDLKTLADFNFDERAYGKYIRDVAKESARRELEGFRKETTERQTQQSREAARTEFGDRATSWAKEQKIEDVDRMFAAPADGGPTVTDAMAETIMESEHGPALLHYLAKNRQVSSQIARMTPLQQAREIGRLEAKLSSGPQPNKVSGAPPPAPRIDGAGVGGGTVKPDTADSDKLTDAEWMRLRNKQVAARQSRIRS